MVVTKGAHTPKCYPDTIGTQLDESLQRLQTDSVEIYLLHRDNPEVPVGEFVSALEVERRAGRISTYGLSNWSLERTQAANDYAAKEGLPSIHAISNHFSLAEMVAPPWPGCVSSSTSGWRTWFEKTQTWLLPWSSQARGLFVPDKLAAGRTDPEFRRSWVSDVNRDRLQRANELAKARGTTPIAIALAYVLSQPFPTFPLIGPRDEAQLDSSLEALDVTLDPDELEWLMSSEGPRGAGADTRG